MKKILLLLIGLVFVFTLTACDKGYTNINNDELREMLASETEYQFVDVRTSAEYYDARIPGFNIQIDYYLLEDDYSLLDRLDKDIPVVIMCNSGNRSVSAAKIMRDQGYEVLYNLKDGIQGWDGETE